MWKKTLSVMLALGILLSLVALPAQAEETVSYPPMIGDLNGDWEAEIDDVTLLQRDLASIPVPYHFEQILADVDGDGYVTVLDVTCFQRWLTGVPVSTLIGNEPEFWIDENAAEKSEPGVTWTTDVIITKIYKDCFYAEPYAPLVEWYKIDAALCEGWCIGDHVKCEIELIRTYDTPDSWTRWNYGFECNLLSIEPSDDELDPNMCYKPVIYLYPEEETEVNVQLTLDGALTHTYPQYQDGWTVTASPDGTLTDQNGASYPYLFWEAKLNTDYDLSKGFCVRGADTADFLNEKLAVLGLSEKEIADFTTFWVPYMQRNPYYVISFQTDAYTDAAALAITPQPDSVIRVFMTWYGSDQAVELPAQELTTPDRTGFTAVEWGGQMIER